MRVIFCCKLNLITTMRSVFSTFILLVFAVASLEAGSLRPPAASSSDGVALAPTSLKGKGLTGTDGPLMQAAQTITLNPTGLTNIVAAGEMRTVGVMFGGGATGFTVPSSGTGAPPSWVTVPAMVDDMNDLEITIAVNTSTSPRSATITFTPTGGPGTATTANLTINQLAAPNPTFALLRTSINFPFTGGPIDVGFTVNTGGGANISLVNTGAADWITPPPTKGVNGLGAGNNMLRIIAAPNTTNMTRSNTITFTYSNSVFGNMTATLNITQDEAPPAVALFPSVLEVSAEGGQQDVRAVLASGATSFTTSGAPSWLTGVPSMGTENPTEITLTLAENTTAAVRTATVTFIPSGGVGTPTNTTLSITQGTYPKANVVEVSNDRFSVGSAASTINVGLGLVSSTTRWSLSTVGGPRGFSTEIISAGTPDFITVTGTSGQGEVLSMNLSANPLSTPRVAELALSVAGSSSPAYTFITIVQAGAAPSGPGLTVSRSRYVLNTIATTITPVVGLLGGATGWTSSGEPSWITVADDGVAGNVSIMASAYTGTSPRVATITLSPTGGSGSRTNVQIQVIQRSGNNVTGNSSRPGVSLSPQEIIDVPAAGIMGRTITLTYVNGATSWAAHASSGLTLTRTSSTAAMETTTDLTVAENTSINPREMRLTFIGGITRTEMVMGRLGPPRVLRIRQQGAAPTTPSVLLARVSHDPALSGVRLSSLDLAAGVSSVSVNVSLGGGATSFSVTGAPAWVTAPSTGTGGNHTISVLANTAATSRTTTLTFAPVGGSGTATNATLVINQQAGASTVVLAPAARNSLSPLGEETTVHVNLGEGGCNSLYSHGCA